MEQEIKDLTDCLDNLFTQIARREMARDGVIGQRVENFTPKINKLKTDYEGKLREVIKKLK